MCLWVAVIDEDTIELSCATASTKVSTRDVSQLSFPVPGGAAMPYWPLSLYNRRAGTAAICKADKQL